jgi:hypothetical protein
VIASGALTDDEFHALDLSGQLANTLGRIIGDGRTRAADLDEMVGHIHVVQHMILAQAAARCYPDHFRLLGGSVA